MPDFNSPEREWGGADPRSYESADGSFFHGALEKNSAGALRLVVYHTTAGGALIGEPWTSHGIVGQGGLVLQANGRLRVSRAGRQRYPPLCACAGGGCALRRAAGYRRGIRMR